MESQNCYCVHTLASQEAHLTASDPTRGPFGVLRYHCAISACCCVHPLVFILSDRSLSVSTLCSLPVLQSPCLFPSLLYFLHIFMIRKSIFMFPFNLRVLQHNSTCRDGHKYTNRTFTTLLPYTLTAHQAQGATIKDLLIVDITDNFIPAYIHVMLCQLHNKYATYFQQSSASLNN